MTGTAARPAPEQAVVRDRFAAAQAVADAVLYEGYLLYPYRRSSAKNRVRWQFGVLAPREWIEIQQIPDPGVAGSAESWFQQVAGLAEADPDSVFRLRLRFLQLLRKQVHVRSADGQVHPVDELDSGTSLEVSFDEALPREYEFAFPLCELLAGEQDALVDIAGDRAVTPLIGADGAEIGQLERTSWPAAARITVSARPAATPFPLTEVQVRVENAAPLDDPSTTREQVLRGSLIAAHLLVGVDRGHFLSLLDPPAWAVEAAKACVNRHVFPVLAGADDGADVLLCSPIILYDHPKIAPESPGDLHDAAEIDEILSLRTLTLTEDEKREARATDPRAAAIVDRVDAMPAEMLAKLHGAVRELRPAVGWTDASGSGGFGPDRSGPAGDELPWWDPRADEAVHPETDTVLVAGRRVGRGSRVRLHPRGRGTDAHDMFLAGRAATVHVVLLDVDGSVQIAVTVDDDPAADVHEWYGRFFHFAPEEIEPIDGDAAEADGPGELR